MSTLHVIDHPMIQHKLTIMRDKETPSSVFRQLLYEISLMMGYEVTRDFPLQDVEVETPLEVATLKKIAGKKVAIVPILRAGLGMVDGMVSMMPNVKVGHVGLFRDPVTLEPVKYYFKLQTPEGNGTPHVHPDGSDARHRRKRLRRDRPCQEDGLQGHPSDVPRGCSGGGKEGSGDSS